MSVADRLRDLGPVDPPPGLSEVGGEQAFVVALGELPDELLTRAADVVWESWGEFGDQPEVIRALASRLADIPAPLEYRDLADGLVVGAVATNHFATAASVAAVLALALDPAAVEQRPLHAGAAARAGADLASAMDGVRHVLLAPLVTMDTVHNDAASPLARAIGRFLDIEDTEWLRALLRDRLLPIPAATADAAVELAYASLRDAFAAADPRDAALALESAACLFEEAARADEERPDAVAFAAAARCALAFASGDRSEMDRRLNEIESCRLMLAAWTPGQSGRARSVVASGAWALLAADLIALRRHLDQPDLLRLGDAVEAIADAYYGARLRIVENERLGFQAYLRPLIVERLRESGQLRDGLDRLRVDAQRTTSRRAAAVHLLEVTGQPLHSPSDGGSLATARTAVVPADPVRVVKVNELAAEAARLADKRGEGAASAFADLVRVLSQFVRKSLDQPPPYQREDADGANAVESQLQDDIWSFLNYTAISKWTGAYEPQKAGGGRADITLTVLDEPMVIECKREIRDSSREAVQQAYAAQAGSYSAAQHAYGAVAILDLTTAQATSTPVFYDCLWLHQQPPEEGGRTLLFVLIPGRRRTPSSISR